MHLNKDNVMYVFKIFCVHNCIDTFETYAGQKLKFVTIFTWKVVCLEEEFFTDAKLVFGTNM